MFGRNDRIRVSLQTYLVLKRSVNDVLCKANIRVSRLDSQSVTIRVHISFFMIVDDKRFLELVVLNHRPRTVAD